MPPGCLEVFTPLFEPGRLLRSSTFVVAIFACATTGIIGSSPAQSTTSVTEIHVQARTGIDNKIFFAGGPRTLYVEVHLHPDAFTGLTIDASVSVASGNMSRREIAAEIAEQLQDDLTDAGYATTFVKVKGEAVYVTNTPAKGPNSGTPEMPIISPAGSTNNRPHLQTYTE